jgi:threonine dehydratase
MTADSGSASPPGLADLPVTLDDVRQAHLRIAPSIFRTPVLRSDAWNRRLGCELFFKAEHLQEAGAFKSRGACNAVFSLDEETSARGVLTHSSGNHAAALARAAERRGIPAYIVMPENSSAVKIEAVRRFGGEITFCESTLAARESVAATRLRETGAVFIPPYDDPRIIAGQGTAALELIEDSPPLDAIIVPVGGGGLLAGTLIAAKSLCPGIQVWAAEPCGADDAYRSWKAGRLLPQENPQTIADGLRTSLGRLNFEVLQRLVDDILLVDDPTIRETVSRLFQEDDWTVEPSGAVSLAALCQLGPTCPVGRIGVILSGGNVDLEAFLGST